MKLKELRKRRSLTLEEVAQAVGTSPENIQRWEDGIEEPSNTMVEKLADYFQCSVGYLKGESNSAPKVVYKEKKKKKSCLVPFLIIIFIFAGSGILLSKTFDSINQKNKSSANLLERKATVNDLSISDKYNFPTSINLNIIPYEDIDGLVLTIEYYTSSDKLIKKQVKAVGNVKAGIQATTTISLTDFSLTEIWSIDYCKYYVSGGTVSLLE